MHIKSQRNFWAGLLFLVVGAAFAWGALNYSFGSRQPLGAGGADFSWNAMMEAIRTSSAKPGPGYFPFGLGVILALLGALVLFQSLTIETQDGDPIGPWAWRPVLVISFAVILFGLLLPKFGLIIALPVLVFVSAFGSDEFHWLTAAINAVVLCVFSWLVFVKGLGLTIPMLPTFAAAG